MRRRPREIATGDDGQIMLLSIAYGVLALLLVGAVVSAASIHLERKALLALADLTALDAADALDQERYFDRLLDPDEPHHPEDLLPITDRSVRASVEAYLATAPAAAELTGLRVVEAVAVDERTAEVTLTSLARPPLLTWVTAGWSDGIVLEVTTRARAYTS